MDMDGVFPYTVYIPTILNKLYMGKAILKLHARKKKKKHILGSIMLTFILLMLSFDVIYIHYSTPLFYHNQSYSLAAAIRTDNCTYIRSLYDGGEREVKST